LAECKKASQKNSAASSVAGNGRRQGRGSEPALAAYGVKDLPYTKMFFRQLAPAWLDHVALLRRFAPPSRESGFAWCELGCGQGVTPVMLAATTPKGRFFGIDAMPEHIRHAKRLAQEAGLANTSFYASDFVSARNLDLPKFDYMVAHGVYSWIDAGSQKALIDLVDAHLAPGGLVHISYNALPGWATDLALRQILYEFGRGAPGGELARITAAAETAQMLVDARAPALEGPRASALSTFNKAYLAHEYLGPSWRPLFVSEFRAATARIGLTPLGHAGLMENYDNFVLKSSARKALEGIADDGLRELARDMFLNRAFRRDVLTRDAPRLGETEQRRRLAASHFALARPAAAVEFTRETAAGKLSYDNDASRRIVAELSRGPAMLSDIRKGSVSRSDLLANALTLCAAEAIRPVEAEGEAAAPRLVETILRRLGTPDELLFLPLPRGTAVPVERGLLQRLRDGRALDEYPGWEEFLAAQRFPVKGRARI
jgi:trans-aconitate methyltransferase